MEKASPVSLLFERLRSFGSAPALSETDSKHSYRDLLEEVDAWIRCFREHEVTQGNVVGFSGDYSPASVSFLLAGFSEGLVPALVPQGPDQNRYHSDGKLCWAFSPDRTGTRFAESSPHPLILRLRERGEAGFIIFTSGSSGVPKAVLHSAPRFLSKFVGIEKKFRTLAFLIFDHIAGLDTLFYSLFSGGLLVIPPGRTPEEVCGAIAAGKVEVLPTSPSFLNLLLLSGVHRHHDLTSLRIITYGSEPISSSTLDRLQEAFPGVSLIQKYGTSEFGSPRSKTRADGGVWLKLDPSSAETKVEDGILWVRSGSTMEGYLNAPFELTQDGWLCTGDRVDVDGDWIRIVGRESEMINVGGEKVYPAEVEAALLLHPHVEDVRVAGEPNPILGTVVGATVRVGPGGPPARELRRELRELAGRHLEPHKVPVRFFFTEKSLAGERHKKVRREEGNSGE